MVKQAQKLLHTQTRMRQWNLISVDYSWSRNIPQRQTVSDSLATAAAAPGSSTTITTDPALVPIGGQVALLPSDWTEHTSCKGYKYYY
ncbi:hypothetical protein C5167_035012 [Papaver somniferum]|uniref:Uncharacterized protein n=1 Tax=Papaver somniferum TaxID=3469 RepID=A0A4Y7KHF7_PAPSO|nr:hypothetical protein C5167_035012 [Papaver somniferum]